MRRWIIAAMLALTSSQALSFQGWWVCLGTPLNNPMGRRVCGQGSDEWSARRGCGFDMVDIYCQQSY